MVTSLSRRERQNTRHRSFTKGTINNHRRRSFLRCSYCARLVRIGQRRMLLAATVLVVAPYYALYWVAIFQRQLLFFQTEPEINHDIEHAALRQWAWKQENCSGFAQKLQRLHLRDDNHNCHRFATIQHMPDAGLGHKLTEIVFGLNFAQATNATFLFDSVVFDVDGNHGRYSWIHDMLPLADHQMTVSELQCLGEYKAATVQKNTMYGQWHTVVRQSLLKENACNVLFATGIRLCCPRSVVDVQEVCYCTERRDDMTVGAFDRAKSHMRELYARSTFVSSAIVFHIHNDGMPNIERSDGTRNEVVTLDSDTIVVAWHVRGGDIVLNGRREFFDTASSQIASSMKDIPYHVFFLGEETLKFFPFLTQVCAARFDGKCSFPTLEAREVLHFMVKSDLLVTSGSSFAYIAALLKTSGVVLNAVSKEGVAGIYELAEHGRLDSNGNVLQPPLSELQTQLGMLHRDKMAIK